jgi:hypothetical protein
VTKASDNQFPSVLFDEQATKPTTPPTGFWRVYAKADGLYIVDDAGTETGPFGTGGGGSSIAESAKATRQSSTQSIANNTTTAVQFDTELWDDNGLINLGTNNDRITIQTSGKYLVVGGLVWDANSSNVRHAIISVNGGAIRAHLTNDASSSNQNASLTVSVILDLVATDYVQLSARQGSGGALNLLADVRNQLAVARVA